ncbi:MAG: hypothetical protein ACKVWV_03615 [Planctomycetota bacterium]
MKSFALLALLAVPTSAQTLGIGDLAVSPAEDRWRFLVVPYLWTASLDGTIAQGNVPEVDVEADFGDLFENLDFAAAAFVSARRGPFVVYSDFSYTELGVEETVAGSSVDIESTIYWVSVAAGHTVSDGNDHSIDLFAGLRYTVLDNEARSSGGVTASNTSNESWLDPLIGFNARTVVSEKVDASLLVDIGGFGVGSDFTYELLPSASYQFTDLLSAHVGFRLLDTNFEDSDFEYDVAQSGWIFGLGFAF